MSNTLLERERGSSEGHQDGDSLTVVVAENDESTLSDVREALSEDGFDVVAEAHDAREAISAAMRFKPQVCLVEVDLPGGGIRASKEIYARVPDTRIAMIAEAAAPDEALRAIHAGADGYLLKRISHDRLGTALRAVARGEPALPRSLTAPLVKTLRTSTGPVERVRYDGLIRRSVLYVPRLLRHYRRRRRSKMPMGEAWRSARSRMAYYRRPA